jgi:HTH-type transcriptional regulator/antitoxin HigA
VVKKIITTEAEYERALARIDKIFDAKPGTPESDEFDLLVLLVEHYEAKHYEVRPPDPIGAIKFRMGQQGLKPKDLIPIFGNTKSVRATLSGQRKLTLANIRTLHERLGIPLDSLVRNVRKPKRLAK